MCHCCMVPIGAARCCKLTSMLMVSGEETYILFTRNVCPAELRLSSGFLPTSVELINGRHESPSSYET